MIKHVYILFFAILMITGCSKEDSEITIQEDAVFRFGVPRSGFNSSSYRIEYLANLKYRIYSEVWHADDNTFGLAQENYYRKVGFDKAEIGRVVDNVLEDPFIKAQFNDVGQLIYVEQIEQPSGATYFYHIEYLSDKIHIDLDYRSGFAGSPLQKIAYGDYFLDDLGNVVRVQKFNYDLADPTITTSIYARSYTYDSSKNPWKGFILPNFYRYLPDDSFFSVNNIVSEQRGGIIKDLNHEYDEDGVITKIEIANWAVDLNGAYNSPDLQYISYINGHRWPWDVE